MRRTSCRRGRVRCAASIAFDNDKTEDGDDGHGFLVLCVDETVLKESFVSIVIVL